MMNKPATKITPCPFSKRYQIPVKLAWQSLRIFYIYHFILANLFVILYFFDTGVLSNSHGERLFQMTSLIYLGVILLSSVALNYRRPRYSLQACFHVILDIVIITLLMHAYGGIGTGIGMLLVVSVAAGGLLAGGLCALFFAALASFAVLSEQIYTHITVAAADISDYASAGTLGLSCFAIALLAHTLAARIEQSEAIADEKSIDIANLQQLNEYIIRHMQSGIIAIDRAQRIRMMNESAVRLFNLLQAPEDLSDVSAELQRLYFAWLANTEEDTAILQNDVGTKLQLRFSRLDKTYKPYDMVFLEDSSRYAQRVQQSKLASLGRLTASIAHEIRNPLSAISHASQLLAESPTLDQQDRRLLEIIGNHTKRVNEIVENILQTSKRTPSRVKSIDLKPWLANFIQEFQLEHRRTRSPFQLEGHCDEIRVRCDPGHLKQILDNLCSNALKYGADETILLRILQLQQTICLEVIDQGPGIAGDAVKHIFEPFFTTSSSGIGLGLYISKELAELNQAKLEYERLESGGSCFRLYLANAEKTVIEI